LGPVVVECDGHPGAVSFRQAGNRNRADVASELPRSVFAEGEPGTMDRSRALSPSHRSCGISRCGAGILPAFSSSYVAVGSADGRARVSDSDLRTLRPPSAVAGY